MYSPSWYLSNSYPDFVLTTLMDALLVAELEIITDNSSVCLDCGMLLDAGTGPTLHEFN